MEISHSMNELIQIWALLIKKKRKVTTSYICICDNTKTMTWQMNLKDLHYLIKSSYSGFLEVYHAL